MSSSNAISCFHLAQGPFLRGLDYGHRPDPNDSRERCQLKRQLIEGLDYRHRPGSSESRERRQLERQQRIKRAHKVCDRIQRISARSTNTAPLQRELVLSKFQKEGDKFRGRFNTEKYPCHLIEELGAIEKVIFNSDCQTAKANRVCGNLRLKGYVEGVEKAFPREIRREKQKEEAERKSLSDLFFRSVAHSGDLFGVTPLERLSQRVLKASEMPTFHTRKAEHTVMAALRSTSLTSRPIRSCSGGFLLASRRLDAEIASAKRRLGK